MKMTAEEYARRVKQVGPRSPLGSDCLWAFCVGGGICLLGEVLRGWYLGMGLEAQLAGTLTSCTLIVLSALLTTLGLYQKLAAKAGAGSLVPITGFAHAGRCGLRWGALAAGRLTALSTIRLPGCKNCSFPAERMEQNIARALL